MNDTKTSPYWQVIREEIVASLESLDEYSDISLTEEELDKLATKLYNESRAFEDFTTAINYDLRAECCKNYT